jgi:hypothetical protein
MSVKDNYEVPSPSEELQASRLTANVNSMLANTNITRSGNPACEASGWGGTHTGPATHLVTFHGERGDQVSAVCAGHLTKIAENAAKVQRAGGPSVSEQISHRPIRLGEGVGHQEKRAIEGIETRLSLEEPLRAYWGDKPEALWGRENQEVGRPGPITDREKQGEEDLKAGAVQDAVDRSAIYGGRQPTPDLTAVDRQGRSLYVDKGPGYIREGQWHPGGVTRIYRFEKKDSSPKAMTEEELGKNKEELISTLSQQAKSGVKQSKSSKKDLTAAPIGEGSGTIDQVIKTYKAGGDYKAQAASLGLSQGDVDFHISRLGQTAVHGGRFVKGHGGKNTRNARAVAVPIGSQEDIETRFESRPATTVAVENVRGAQQQSSISKEKLNKHAERLRRVEEFRRNFETGGNK